MSTSGHSNPSITREMYDEVMTPNYAPMSIMPEKGQGSLIWDTDGKRYIDFAAGIAVSALGHAHPELVKVLTEQASRYWHVSNLLTNTPAIELAQKLCSLTFADKAFFANSGAEVNEAALKLARRYAFDHFGPEKDEIIAFDNSFHGRTFFTVCVGGQAKYSDGFGPKPGGITHLPFNDIDALSAAFSDKTCAVILEPIQGEGGVNPAQQAFVEQIRLLCDQHNALLIFDEIQTGVGRTGKLYHYQNMQVEPDILTTAKGLGGGFPVAAMLTRGAIADSLVVGTHGSTFGGNPMACAVANRVLELVPDMLPDVQQKSDMLCEGLAAINKKYDIFSDIRGYGLLIGAELNAAWQDRARDVLTSATDKGLLMLVAGPNVLRFAPPLNIESELMLEGLALLDDVVASLS